MLSRWPVHSAYFPLRSFLWRVTKEDRGRGSTSVSPQCWIRQYLHFVYIDTTTKVKLDDKYNLPNLTYRISYFLYLLQFSQYRTLLNDKSVRDMCSPISPGSRLPHRRVTRGHPLFDPPSVYPCLRHPRLVQSFIGSDKL